MSFLVFLFTRKSVKLSPWPLMRIDVAPPIFNVFQSQKGFEKLFLRFVRLFHRIYYSGYFSNSKIEVNGWNMVKYSLLSIHRYKLHFLTNFWSNFTILYRQTSSSKCFKPIKIVLITFRVSRISKLLSRPFTENWGSLHCTLISEKKFWKHLLSQREFSAHYFKSNIMSLRP